jgi:restriction system protein
MTAAAFLIDPPAEDGSSNVLRLLLRHTSPHYGTVAKTRRKNDGLGDEVVDGLFQLMRHLPWWSGLIFIGLTWLLFAYGLPALAALFNSDPKSMVRVMVQVFVPFAPVMALLVAGLWVVALVKKHQDRRLLGRQRSLDDLRALDWRDFERLVAAAYRGRGYFAVETAGGADGGVDLVLEGRESGHPAKLYVQCKQWKTRQIGVRPVRELAGVVAAAGGQAADVRGVFVTSGHYTNDAQRFAEQSGIELVDGTALLELVRSAQADSPASTTPQNSAPAHPAAAAIPDAAMTPSTAEVPACPRCGKPMTQRVARRGEHAGRTFWGCTAFPTCRGTRA